jgi:hypothetical protein
MGAKKGNKNALGNEGGKPPFYTDPLEMQMACDNYFAKCEEDKEPLTITGLALALGFSTRKSLLDYSEKIEFVNIIKKAHLKVECGYEKRLSAGQPTGAIFALKNMNWHDKTELTGNEGKDLFPVSISFKDFKNGQP